MVSKRARANNTVGTRLAAVQAGMEELQARTRTPAPDTTPERLEVVERRLELLSSANYRAEEDLLVRGSDYAHGLLDPAYIGPGPARVSFLPDGTLSDDPYEWRGDFYPWGNRVVNMIRIDGRWFIDGHTSQSMDALTGIGRGGIVKLDLLNGWQNYSQYTGSFQYAEAQAQRLHSGIVVLSGLIGNGTITSGTVIATLPPSMRPDTDLLLPTLNGNNYRSLTISANGDIVVRGGWIASFITLDGIAFPAQGTATWTEIGAAGSGSSYANGWTNYDTNPIWGKAAYWKDPYGLVWFRGLIDNGTRGTDDTTMVNLPATHRAHMQQHNNVVASDTFGFVGTRTTGGIDWKAGTGGGWHSLASLRIITSDALTASPWWTPVYSGGWLDYNVAQFTSLGLTRRPDGLGLSKGLAKSGSLGAGTRLTTAPRHMLPAMTWLTPRVSGQVAARMDMYGHKGLSTGTLPGQISPNFGAASWFSLDGMVWMIGEL
ncbi:hypothetical protein SEA_PAULODIABOLI_101 [Microbacterium phage PauloDiaboli]|nr:hypothetical protein SEA_PAULODIABOLI_101 [Microbacterium phage PauloDiaboli]QWY83951.1 hypothetical protein SEA_A3WALLY_101 [Microbacterium phage A3Wally]